MNKFILLAAAAVWVTAPAVGSYVKDYRVEKLSKHSSAELDGFGQDLATALNALQHCPQKVKDTFRFGHMITDLHIANDRTGINSTTLKYQGSYPLPSSGTYKGEIKVVSQIVKTPHVPDAPPKRTYDCTVTEK